MSGLRVEIDLDKIGENARRLVDRTAAYDVSVTGVTKAMLGDPRLARVLVAAGVVGLADSRIENIERMRHAHVPVPMLLARSPMPSQADRVVRSNTMSVNVDTEVLTLLATAARVCGRVHDVMIMVELGDLRDGVMPSELHSVVRHVLRHPTLRLRGIGANLACRHGIEPSDRNMAELTGVVEDVEATFGIAIHTVSGGNSANLGWLTSTERIGRINDLRLGESILLGRDPLDRRPISGLHTDAIVFVGEVIESWRKPSRPWGRSRQPAFRLSPGADGVGAERDEDSGEIWQTIVAAGRQDIDPDDIRSRGDATVLAASSDHLLLSTRRRIAPGDEMRFEAGYSAVLRAMTSPFVDKQVHQEHPLRPTIAASNSRPPRPDTGTHNIRQRSRLTIVPRPNHAEHNRRARVETPGGVEST